MNNYPQYKILIWRFVRAGLAGGLGTVSAISIILKPDLSNIKVWGIALLSGFIGGFITAIVKALRDSISGGDQTALVNKLPL